MTGFVLAALSLVVLTVGLAMLAVPRETSDTFTDRAERIGLPTGIYNPNVVRFTAVLFIVGSIVFAVVGLSMVSAGR